MVSTDTHICFPLLHRLPHIHHFAGCVGPKRGAILILHHRESTDLLLHIKIIEEDVTFVILKPILVDFELLGELRVLQPSCSEIDLSLLGLYLGPVFPHRLVV